MVARSRAVLTSGTTRQAVKASEASSLTARPKAPLLSNMVVSTKAVANITPSILFMICPSFPVPIKDSIVKDGSDIFWTARRVAGRTWGR